jgi:Tol biopolymer transport system component
MTGHDDFDRTLAGWFEADALSPAPAGGLDRVLDATRRRRPRPAWLAGPGGHWVGEADHPGSGTGVRSLPRLGLRWSTAVILLLVIAAVVGGAILVGARLVQSSPLPTGRLGHLAYGLDGDIYLADWDGRNPTRIAHAPPDGPADCYGFGGEGRMWSPDGRHIAYRSGGAFCPGATVLISDPAGHVVASFPGTGWLISWSPDSTRVATWVELSQTIGIYGLDGVRQALLTVPPGCALPGDFDPVWSPDGRSLVVWPCEVPVDRRTPRRLPADDPRSHEQWAHSPDGARAVYITAESLVVAAADGSQDRVLIPIGVTLGGLPPVWSPTGDRIAFNAGPSLSEPDEIRIVDVASGKVTRLAGVRGVGPSHLLSFSPEGDRVLFWQADANDAQSLWTVHTDGSDAQLLVEGTSWGDWQRLPASP